MWVTFVLKNNAGFVITGITTPVKVAAGAGNQNPQGSVALTPLQNQVLVVKGSGTYAITTPYDVVLAMNGWIIDGTPTYYIIPANGGAVVQGNVANLVNNMPAVGKGTFDLGQNGVAITPAGNYKVVIIMVVKGNGADGQLTQQISSGWKVIPVAAAMGE